MEHSLDHPQKCIGLPKFKLPRFAPFLIALDRRLYLLRIYVIFTIHIRMYVNSFLYPYCTDVLARGNVWAFPGEYFRTRDHLLRPIRLTSTGLFTSPSGISELDCAATKTDTAERSVSIGRESLQVFFVLGALAYFQVPPLGGSREEKWRSQ